MRFDFDHLVLGAADLAEGDAWVERVFGVSMPTGGAHPDFGTHNRLARLPFGYLELIAIDPAAKPPPRPRWYGLDDSAVQARLAERPRPLAWVLNCDDLAAAKARAGWDIGPIIEARRGDLTWRIAVPREGGAVEAVLPLLIEWPESLGRRPPVARMSDIGLALRELRLRHPDPAGIGALLETVGAEAAAGAAGFALRLERIENDESRENSIEAVFMRPQIAVSV